MARPLASLATPLITLLIASLAKGPLPLIASLITPLAKGPLPLAALTGLRIFLVDDKDMI